MDYFEQVDKNDVHLEEIKDVSASEKAFTSKKSDLHKYFGNIFSFILLLISLACVISSIMLVVKFFFLFFKVNNGHIKILSMSIYILCFILFLVYLSISLFGYFGAFINSKRKNSMKFGFALNFLKKLTNLMKMTILYGLIIYIISFAFGISTNNIVIKVLMFGVVYALLIISISNITHFYTDLYVSSTSLHKLIPKATKLKMISLTMCILFGLGAYYFVNNYATLFPSIFNESYALGYIFIGEERAANYFAKVDMIKNLTLISLGLLVFKNLYTILYLSIYDKSFSKINDYLRADLKRIETNRENEFF